MKTLIMLRKSTFALAVCLLAFSACKDDVKPSEVEKRKEISSELEKAGLQKQSHHDDDVIAALNVIYKTPFASLSDENKSTLDQWNTAIGYNGAQDLYDDMFASFSMSEQVASLIKEYSDKEYTSIHERDVYNQTVSLLFLKKNDMDTYEKNINTFTEIYSVIGEDLTKKGVKVDAKTWNESMSKNFEEYWYVQASRILEADQATKNNRLKEFLNREAS